LQLASNDFWREKVSTLEQIGDDVRKITARAAASVVGVGGWRGVSGFAIAPGRVITATHGIRDEEVALELADGTRGSGRVVAIDRGLGLAAVEIEADAVAPLEWAEQDPPVGAAVIALAKPGRRGMRAAVGFVAAVDRTIRGPRGRRLDGVLEHSAPLPRGASGGPLLDASGRLVGVNLLRLEGGLIAAPGTRLRDRLDRLARGEAIRARHLGIAVAPPYVARRLQRALGLPERDGVLVRGVAEGTPAEAAGLERGDLIVAVDGEPLTGIDALHEAVDRASGALSLTVIRGAEERVVELEPVEEPTR
jgi:serine protease Do